MKIFVFDYFFKFECLNMLSIADDGGTCCAGLLHNRLLPVYMARLCKIRLFFNLECLHILEDTKECEVFLNTEVEEVQSTLQFSPTVSPQLRKSVRPSTLQLSYFPTHDFANFWSEVRYWYSKTSNTAGFLIKIFFSKKGLRQFSQNIDI